MVLSVLLLKDNNLDCSNMDNLTIIINPIFTARLPVCQSHAGIVSKRMNVG